MKVTYLVKRKPPSIVSDFFPAINEYEGSREFFNLPNALDYKRLKERETKRDWIVMKKKYFKPNAFTLEYVKSDFEKSLIKALK